MAASDAGASSGIPEAENCGEIRLFLSALVDGEATSDEATRAKNHVLTCANCASHLAFLRLTGRALSQVPRAYPSPALSARIAAATYERPTLGERIAGWLRPAPVRVGLGTALATGLALLLVVPRMGSEVATNFPPAAVPGSSPAFRKAPARATTPRSVARTTAPKSTGVVRPTPVSEPTAPPKTASLPQSTAPAANTAVASAAEPAKSVRPVNAAAPAPRRAAPAAVKSAPVLVASAVLRGGGGLPGNRTDPPMDRHSSLRSSAGLRLKTPGSGRLVIPRSGYDRAAVTEPVLRPHGTAPFTSALPVASGAAPILSPLPSESAAVKLPESGSGSAERVASRLSPSVPTASAAEAAVPGSKALHFRINSPRPSNTQTLALSGAGSGPGNLSASDPYSFGSGSAARMSIASAPMK